MALALAFFAAPGAARAQVPAIDGTPLNIFADGIGSLQVQFDGRGEGEFCCGGGLGGNGFALATSDGVSLPGSGDRDHLSGPDVVHDGAVFTATSDYDVTDLHLHVHEVITYADGTRDVRLHYAVTNLGDAPVTFRAGELADLELGRSDSGEGVYAAGPPRFVGGLTPDRRASGLVEQTPWTHYEQGHYNAIFDDFRDGSLQDTIDPFNEDDGAGAEWVFANVAHDATVPIDVTWSFEDDTFVTNTGADHDGECDADCTLREALLHAPAGSVITVPSGRIQLDPALGELVAPHSVTVVGAGATDGTTVDAGGQSRVLEVVAGASVALSRVRLTGGGGQSAGGDTGGTAAGHGGAVAVQHGATLELDDSEVSDSSASASGGGVYNEGTFIALRSTLARNTAGGGESDGGGAVFNAGSATIAVSTLSGNRAANGQGGAINSSGPLALYNATIAGNSAHAGGGVARFLGAPVSAFNTILDENQPAACSGTPGPITTSHNLIQDESCQTTGADVVNQHARLEELDNYGGQTETRPPVPGSLAIDAGDDGFCGGTLIGRLDQLLQRRVSGPHCDVGAVEHFDDGVDVPPPPEITTPRDGDRLNTGTVTFRGTAPGGFLVQLFSDDLDTDETVPVGEDGKWSFVWPGLSEGTYAFSARTIDPDTDVGSEVFGPVTITIDLTPPQPPQITDAGASGSTVTLHGTAEPASAVTILEGDTALTTVTSDGGGAWTAVLAGVAPGSHAYTAVAGDGAGNRSGPSGARGVVVAQTVAATPTPSPTPAPTPLPPPVEGRQVNAQTKSGTIKIKLPGSNTFVVLGPGQQVPVGTTIDTTNGRMTLTTDVNGKTQHADFYEGVFKVGQSKGARPLTTLTLNGPKPACSAKASAAAKPKKKVKQRRLWGSGSGSFRTTGSYSAATVRGTTWLTQDTCSGTLTKVTQGVVEVRDLVKRKTVVIRAGHTYLARPKKR